MTLPEELAEAVRAEVGPGEFSGYVTHALQRQWDGDRLGQLIEGWTTCASCAPTASWS